VRNCSTAYRESYVLVSPSSPLPFHPTEACNTYLHSDLRIAPRSTSASRPTSFCWTGHGANDLGVAHFQIAGPVCCGLSRNLRVDASQLVPPSAIETQEGEGIGRGVKGHVECGWMAATFGGPEGEVKGWVQLDTSSCEAAGLEG